MSTLFTDTPFHSWWWHVIHHHPPPLRQEEVNSRLKEPLFSHLKLHAAFFKHKNSFFLFLFFLGFVFLIVELLLREWARLNKILLEQWEVANYGYVSRTDCPSSESVSHLLSTTARLFDSWDMSYCYIFELPIFISKKKRIGFLLIFY